MYVGTVGTEMYGVGYNDLIKFINTLQSGLQLRITSLVTKNKSMKAYKVPKEDFLW